MRGYMFTILTVLMFLSLFTVTYYFWGKSMASAGADITAQKTAGVFDDVAGDLSSLTGLMARIDTTDPVVVRFDDRVPAAWDVTASVRNYSVFLQGAYADEIGAKIEFSPGSLSATTAASDFRVYPYMFSYGWSNNSKDVVWLRNASLDLSPTQTNLTLDLKGENIEDLVWTEAEDFTYDDSGLKTEGEDFSGGFLMEDFAYMTKTVEVPFPMNYTLWVRAVYDDTEKNFTVEVDGRNATRFDIWNPEGSGDYKWFNDTLVVFNLTEGPKTIKVFSSASSCTESLDVVVLTTKYMNFGNSAPITPGPDPFEFNPVTGGDWEANLDILFSNVNYTLATSELSRTAASEWNMTFNDGDWMRLQLGGTNRQQNGISSAHLTSDSSQNGSSGLLNLTASFSPGGKAYVDSGCDMTLAGKIRRSGTVWLATG